MGLTAPHLILPAWLLAATLAVLFSAVLALFSRRFGYDVEVIDMPCLTLVGFLVGAGVLYSLGLPSLIRASMNFDAQKVLLAIVVLAGLGARLILFASEPILEDDYQRYLWDGAVTASGHNPYAASPLAVMEGHVQDTYKDLAADAGPVLPRINHKSLTTIYPPVAQAAFALAYLVEPWSLAAWRGVLLAFDLGTLALLVVLLDATGRSRLWCALYWLNPLVLKEVFNSAHMEAVLLPFLLLAMLLAVRQKALLATGALGLAAGAKFWPVLLFPLLARHFRVERRLLAIAAFIFACLFALWLAPMFAGGVTPTTGLVAYLDRWQTNSAHFPAIVGMILSFLDWAGYSEAHAGGLARALIAFTLIVLAAALSYRRTDDANELIARASVLVAALVLLSPAQYPWYTVWMAPFLVFRPYKSFLLLTMLIPLYYALFHFAARGTPEIFTSYVVWAIWVPVWAVLLWEVSSGAFSEEAREHARRRECVTADTSA